MSSAFGNATQNRSNCLRDRVTNAKPSSQVMLSPPFSIRPMICASAIWASLAWLCATRLAGEMIARNVGLVKENPLPISVALAHKCRRLSRGDLYASCVGTPSPKIPLIMSAGTCLKYFVHLWVGGHPIAGRYISFSPIAAFSL